MCERPELFRKFLGSLRMILCYWKTFSVPNLCSSTTGSDWGPSWELKDHSCSSSILLLMPPESVFAKTPQFCLPVLSHGCFSMGGNETGCMRYLCAKSVRTRVTQMTRVSSLNPLCLLCQKQSSRRHLWVIGMSKVIDLFMGLF